MHAHHQHDEYTIDWADAVDRLGTSARDERDWYAEVAADLLTPDDRTAVDVGCGGGGMTLALADRLPAGGLVVAVDSNAMVLDNARNLLGSGTPKAAVSYVLADLDADLAPVRQAVGAGADLVWASASVHHSGDQQAAVDKLAGLLAPGGRLALAEGGLPARHLPWDLGVGEPGLEVRMLTAQDRWVAAMRAHLPGSVRMPYGWSEALRRAGLTAVTARSRVIEWPAPLPEPVRQHVVSQLAHRVERVRSSELLPPADGAAWDRLLDPGDEAWLGHRDDLYRLEARTVHTGTHQP